MEESKVADDAGLRSYEEFLAAVLDESKGRLSDQQLQSLDSLRSKHEITDLEHNNALKKLGWSHDRLERASAQLPAEYITFLKAILVDGVIEESDANSLIELKRKHNITTEDHSKALRQLGVSERVYLSALARGAQTRSRTVERFGKSKSKIVEGPVDRDEYCRGFCISPHLHQWWDKDPKTNARIIVREPGADNRVSSTHELFFDLVVVAVLDEAVHLFRADYSAWFSFIVSFMCIWRIWNTTMLYHTSWGGNNDITTRLLTFVQMVGLLLIGLSLDESFEHSGTRSFGVGFAISLWPLIFLFFWAAVRRKRGFGWAAYQTVIFGIPALIVAVTVSLPAEVMEGRYIYCYLVAALFSEFSPYLVQAWPMLRNLRQPINPEHMTERLSLIILIVMGESIVALMVEVPWNLDGFIWEILLSLLSGLAIAISLKWLYFDVDEEKETHPLRRTVWHGGSWTIAHHPLSMAIVASAAGFNGVQKQIIKWVEETYETSSNKTQGHGSPLDLHSSHSNMTSPAASADHKDDGYLARIHEFVFCGSLATALLILTGMAALAKFPEKTLLSSKVRLIVRGIFAILIGVLPLFGIDFCGGLGLVLIVAALMIALAFFEMISSLESHGDEHQEDFSHSSLEQLRSTVSKSLANANELLLPKQSVFDEDEDFSESFNEDASERLINTEW